MVGVASHLCGGVADVSDGPTPFLVPVFDSAVVVEQLTFFGTSSEEFVIELSCSALGVVFGSKGLSHLLPGPYVVSDCRSVLFE